MSEWLDLGGAMVRRDAVTVLASHEPGRTDGLRVLVYCTGGGADGTRSYEDVKRELLGDGAERAQHERHTPARNGAA